LSAALGRRHVLGRRAAGLLRLARPRPFLVHGARSDLLGQALGAALIAQALLDVLVLALALGAPGLLRHDALLPSVGGCPGARVGQTAGLGDGWWWVRLGAHSRTVRDLG